MAASSGESGHFDLSSPVYNSIVVDPDEISDGDSEGTLLDDEDEVDFVEPTLEAEIHPSSNEPVTDPNFEQKMFFRLDGMVSGTLKPGKTAELHDKDFLRIAVIWQHRITKEVILQGVRYRRNMYLHGLVERKLNEVTMMLVYSQYDFRDILIQSVITVGLHEVSKIHPGITRMGGADYTMTHGRLVCRHKLLFISKNEGYVQMLRVIEADEGCSSPDNQLRQAFPGQTQKGGSCASWLDGETDFDRRAREKCGGITLLHFHSRNPRILDLTLGPSHSQRYTFGDAFCGGGGASCGAKGAGVYVGWGFDFSPNAMDTYKRNFWGARCENTAAHIFATIITEDFKVDILHLSPPCQTFSPIHVHHGKDDEMNEATFSAVEEIIRKVKPRIMTLEETFGLTQTPEKLAWFHSLIQAFTKLGFSVCWKVFNLRDFGLPQPRRRLFVMASCPGEPLPDWPEATHCATTDLARFPHLLPFSSVNDAIGHIPKDFSLHNPEQVMKRNEHPYDGNLPLKNTITTQGVMNYHPSGKRNFTTRELACLQGFPFEHEFGPHGIRKQIGNAVPPIVAKNFFEHIKRFLQMTDELR